MIINILKLLQICQSGNRSMLVTLQFFADTARQLKENGKVNDFTYLADKSTELLNGNLMLKKLLLLEIYHKCGTTEYASMMNYLELETLINNSDSEMELRKYILPRIGRGYLETADYTKAMKYTLWAENIPDELKNKSFRTEYCETSGNAYSILAMNDKTNHFSRYLQALTLQKYKFHQYHY